MKTKYRIFLIICYKINAQANNCQLEMGKKTNEAEKLAVYLPSSFDRSLHDLIGKHHE